MHRNYFENPNYTGGLAEEEVFGRNRESLSFQDFKERYRGQRLSPREMIMAREEAFDDIRRTQVDTEMTTSTGLVLRKGPSNPSKFFARALRSGVQKEFEKIDKDVSVKFYTAVHTVLDYMHGVDAFIDIVAKDNVTGEEMLVGTITYDVSMRDAKDKEGRADITFVYRGVDLKEDREEYLALVEDVVSQSMNVIESKEILIHIE